MKNSPINVAPREPLSFDKTAFAVMLGVLLAEAVTLILFAACKYALKLVA